VISKGVSPSILVDKGYFGLFFCLSLLTQRVLEMVKWLIINVLVKLEARSDVPLDYEIIPDVRVKSENASREYI